MPYKLKQQYNCLLVVFSIDTTYLYIAIDVLYYADKMTWS